MDITEKNGQPSMEEILASIRRIIAEEPAGSPTIELKSKVISVNPEQSLDEPSEFDLPAIFRTPAPAPEKSTPLLGRLTDAIRGATAATPESRAARAGDEAGAEPADHGGGGHGNATSQPFGTLSSLKGGRHEPLGSEQRHGEDGYPDSVHPAPADAPPAPALVKASSPGWKFGRSSAPPPAVEEEVKRIMAPFKDTHFLNITPSSQPTEPASPPSSSPLPAPAPQAPARRVDFGAIIPAHLDLPGVPSIEQRRHVESSPEPSAAPWLERPNPPHQVDNLSPVAANPLTPSYHEAAALRPPPPPMAQDEHYPPFRATVPLSAHESSATGTIEDTTAELLRPMLRQWLADNMPRMVEKALHIEVAESVRTSRKPTGQ
jgi:hypothetical protein